MLLLPQIKNWNLILDLVLCLRLCHCCTVYLSSASTFGIVKHKETTFLNPSRISLGLKKKYYTNNMKSTIIL